MPSMAAAAIDENTNPFATQLRLPKQTHLLVSTREINNTIEPTSITTSITNLLTSTASATCISLKRKRPPKIQIPLVLREIQTDKIRNKDNNKGDEDSSFEYSEPGVGVFCMKGKKKVMEDTHKIVSCLKEGSKKGFFGVFDGHGGRKASEFVAENLHKNIMAMLEKPEKDLGKEEAIKAGYLKTDEEFLKQGVSSGSCCVTCLIEEQDITVSNLGDCRAVLCRGGVAEALTKDHTARREDERNRIESKGGFVEIHRGTWRIHGILSVSRSIGDVHLKDWVLAVPDTKILSLTPDMEFLVLASDGLWEKVDNQEVIDTAKRVYFGQNKLGSTCDIPKEHDQFACENTSPPSKSRRISLVKQQKINSQSPDQERSGYKNRPITGGLVSACKELVNLALTRGSMDDITVMIIDLGHFRSNK